MRKHCKSYTMKATTGRGKHPDVKEAVLQETDRGLSVYHLTI